LLIDKGAELNARDDRQQTPLHWAAESGQFESVELLLSKDADPTSANAAGLTARYMAEIRNHSRVAELLATSERWHGYVKRLLDPDGKLSASQLVNDAGQPTEALKNLVPNDLFGHLARPDFYRQGMDGLAEVFPHLPATVQATIDLTPWRRAKAQEANAAARPEDGFKRYVRPRRTPPSDITKG
jgi:Ankyrin repeats (3 copies)